MTLSRIALHGVALLICLFAISSSPSEAAQLVDVELQNEDLPSIIHRNLLAAMKPEKEMIKYCSSPKNRKKKVQA